MPRITVRRGALDPGPRALSITCATLRLASRAPALREGDAPRRSGHLAHPSRRIDGVRGGRLAALLEKTPSLSLFRSRRSFSDLRAPATLSAMPATLMRALAPRSTARSPANAHGHPRARAPHRSSTSWLTSIECIVHRRAASAGCSLARRCRCRCCSCCSRCSRCSRCSCCSARARATTTTTTTTTGRPAWLGRSVGRSVVGRSAGRCCCCCREASAANTGAVRGSCADTCEKWAVLLPRVRRARRRGARGRGGTDRR
jgi:hypothetical protein